MHKRLESGGAEPLDLVWRGLVFEVVLVAVDVVPVAVDVVPVAVDMVSAVGTLDASLLIKIFGLAKIHCH